MSQRRRNYEEKRKFQQELAEYENDEYDELWYEDMEDWDDYEDDYCDNSYYDDNDYYVESDYEHYDWLYDDDIGKQEDYEPGNHLRDENGNTYVVATDYRLINILTGEYTNSYMLRGLEVIL